MRFNRRSARCCNSTKGRRMKATFLQRVGDTGDFEIVGQVDEKGYPKDGKSLGPLLTKKRGGGGGKK